MKSVPGCPSRNPRWADGAFLLSCGFSVWSLVIGSVLAHSGSLSFAGVVNLAHPVLDAVVLAGVFFVGP
jgi:hypothetical protein